MKYSIFLLMIIAAGCGEAAGTKHIADSTEAQWNKPEDERLAKAEAFLQLFPIINPNDFEVSSPNTDSNGVMKGLVGKWIDSNMVHWLPDDWEKREIGMPGELYGGYFAIGRFPVGDYEMLIVRAPGEYESSAIKLLAWYKPSAECKDHILLADHWGDAGESQYTYSWLHPGNNQLEVRMGVNYIYGDPEDTTGRTESSSDYRIFYFRDGAFDTTGMSSRRNEAFFRSKLKDSYLEPDSVYVEYHPNSNSDSHE